MMVWEKLLSTDRLSESTSTNKYRTVFNQDFGRVLYSSAFRRLQDKTQVFPLGRNDYVRTRLTHSLEVSNVGRSLAIRFQDIIAEKENIDNQYLMVIADIVATACLAHDIGNPPFGHSGEKAIECAVHKLSDKKDYTFEGNAQGFRVLTCIGDPIKGNGLDLTCATLGAFTKYPCTALSRQEDYYSKYGVNKGEIDKFRRVAKKCGLDEPTKDLWVRHPLAYLMEAADDISYLIADLEDAYISGILSYEKVMEQYNVLANFSCEDNSSLEKEKKERGEVCAVRHARARAVGVCIEELENVMRDDYQSIKDGTLKKGLMDNSKLRDKYDKVKAFSQNHIYTHESVVNVEITGFNVILKLIELYMEWVYSRKSPISKKIEKVLHPEQSMVNDRDYRFAHIIDYVSGMTDSFALKTYNELFGRLPTI